MRLKRRMTLLQLQPHVALPDQIRRELIPQHVRVVLISLGEDVSKGFEGLNVWLEDALQRPGLAIDSQFRLARVPIFEAYKAPPPNSASFPRCTPTL